MRISRQMKCAKLTCDRRQQTSGLCRQHYILAMRGKPTGFVDPAPTVAHIKTLGESGISQKRLGQLVDIPQTTIWHIAAGRRKKLYAITAHKILSVPVPDAPWNVAAPNAIVPLVGTQRRLRALMAAGYTSEMMAARIGVYKRAVVKITADDQTFVSARTARAVAEMFEEWRLTPGPSKATRNRSAAKRWPPPSAWDVDEIDDPNAEPVRPARVDFADQVADHRAIGRTDDQIAEAMGIKMNSLNSLLTRHGLPKGRRYRDIEEHLALMYDNSMSKQHLKVS